MVIACPVSPNKARTAPGKIMPQTLHNARRVAAHFRTRYQALRHWILWRRHPAESCKNAFIAQNGCRSKKARRLQGKVEGYLSSQL